MFYLSSFDAKTHINNNALNRTVTLSALFSSIKSVTRNLGGFFSPSVFHTSYFNTSNILAKGELDADSVVRFYRTTAASGKLYNVKYFNLPMGDSTIRKFRIVRQKGSITKEGK